MIDGDEDNKMPNQSRPGLKTTALPAVKLQGGSDKSVTGAKPILNLTKENVIIGIWNVRTLQCGKMKELEHELKQYQWDIVGLSEVRWTGFGETITEDSHKIWNSGKESRHEHGVDFW